MRYMFLLILIGSFAHASDSVVVTKPLKVTFLAGSSSAKIYENGLVRCTIQSVDQVSYQRTLTLAGQISMSTKVSTDTDELLTLKNGEEVLLSVKFKQIYMQVSQPLREHFNQAKSSIMESCWRVSPDTRFCDQRMRMLYKEFESRFERVKRHSLELMNDLIASKKAVITGFHSEYVLNAQGFSKVVCDLKGEKTFIEKRSPDKIVSINSIIKTRALTDQEGKNKAEIEAANQEKANAEKALAISEQKRECETLKKNKELTDSHAQIYFKILQSSKERHYRGGAYSSVTDVYDAEENYEAAMFQYKKAFDLYIRKNSICAGLGIY